MKTRNIMAIVLILLVLTAGIAIAGKGGIKPSAKNITLVVSAGGYKDTPTMDYKYIGGHGAMQVSISGSGTATATVLSSVDGITFVESEERKSKGALFTGVTSASGTVIVGLTPVATPKIKIRLGESGGSDSYTATVRTCLEYE